MDDNKEFYTKEEIDKIFKDLNRKIKELERQLNAKIRDIDYIARSARNSARRGF